MIKIELTPMTSIIMHDLDLLYSCLSDCSSSHSETGVHGLEQKNNSGEIQINNNFALDPRHMINSLSNRLVDRANRFNEHFKHSSVPPSNPSPNKKIIPIPNTSQ